MAVELITTNDKMTAQEHISCKLSALKPPREFTIASDFTWTGLPSSFHGGERLNRDAMGPKRHWLSYQLEVGARASGTRSKMQAKQIFAFFAVQVLSLQMYFIQGKRPKIDLLFRI